jgi:hypothetical protein
MNFESATDETLERMRKALVAEQERRAVPYATFPVHGDSGKKYWITVGGGVRPSCSCPAFTFFKGHPQSRVCKHIKRAVLGGT